MELSAQLPADLLALAAAAGRASPVLLPPPGSATDGADAAMPFDALLLQLAGTATPGGDALPASGNDLPSAPADLRPEDAPAADGLAVSGLLALVASPQPPVEPSPPEVASGPPASVPVAVPPTPGELAKLQQLRAALDRAAAPATAPPDAGDVVAAASYPPADLAAPETVVAGQSPAVSRASADGAPPQPAAVASTSDRVVATIVAAQSAPAAEAAAPVARAAGEPRSSAERRTASAATNTPADAPRASAAPLSQLFDLALASSTGDRPAAPQAARATEPLPIVLTPSAASAASQPIAPPHSSGSSVPHAAVALDGSTLTATSSPAHPGGSVDTTAARWHDALASRVQWLVDHDIGEARIKLNPPELGALDVKISLHDDKTFVQLTAHNAAARDELSQSLPRLRELLSANGLELGGATVSGGRDERAGGYPGNEPAARSSDFAAATDPEPVVRAIRGASSQIDVFA
jgi:flagellar hook-length control protein FliK